MESNKLRIRRLGILLKYSRIDKHSVREYWLYRRKEYSFVVFDPSSFCMAEETSRASEEEFEDVRRTFNLTKKQNRRLRERGKMRYGNRKNRKLLKKWKERLLLSFNL